MSATINLMNYRNPSLSRALAAEYVFGTLRGPARRRFERVMACQASLRADVYFWELRLAEMTEAVPPVKPPAGAWDSLRAGMDRIGSAEATGVPLCTSNSATRRASKVPVGGRRRRILIGLATAAALVLGVRIGQYPTASKDRPDGGGMVSRDSGAQAQDALLYVALLKVPTSKVEWLVSLSADRRQINVVAAGDYPRLGQRKVQLWLISPSSGPVALGVLPSRSGASANIVLPKTLDQDAGSGFDLAVSLEPEDSSPSDLPEGPVVTWARNLTAQYEPDRGI